jgi:hypothetical protein
MPAGRYNFTIEQGATTSFEITYSDASGNPIDLTGKRARMQLKNEKKGNTTYLSLTSDLASDGTGLTLGGTSGSIGIYISSDVTTELNFDTAFYDLEISTIETYPRVTRLLEGIIVLSKEVTTYTGPYEEVDPDPPTPPPSQPTGSVDPGDPGSQPPVDPTATVKTLYIYYPNA